ncbi:hypothetical protein R0K18_31015, partial [Pantoea sp. SIMBA_133]
SFFTAFFAGFSSTDASASFFLPSFIVHPAVVILSSWTSSYPQSLDAGTMFCVAGFPVTLCQWSQSRLHRGRWRRIPKPPQNQPAQR